MHCRHRLALNYSSGVVDCPFLYQTRTILCHRDLAPQRRSLSDNASTSRKQTPRKQTSREKPSPDAGSTSFLKAKAAQVASTKPKLGPSITAAEQAAFDNIWALFKKPAPSTTKARATSTDHTDTDYKNILELFSTPQQPNEVSGEEPLEAFLDQQSRSPPETQPDAQKATKHTNFVDEAPTPLQQSKLTRESAISEIQDFLNDTTSQPDPSSFSASSNTQIIQSVALTIVEDVANSLTTALKTKDIRPDIAMWQVAEEKIFPLIKLLRPSKGSLSSPSRSTTDTSPNLDTSKPQTDPQLPSQTHPLIPADTPLLPLLSQTYPSLTLLILRLYTTHHPSSPYALALLPTLKSLGPTSYVLGAHTHFYNTLLSLYWQIYSDLRGMNTLLTEMEANGVDFDVSTWEAVKAIEEDRHLDLDGRGERGKMWWQRMEQRTWWPKVGVEWREVIKRRLDEKGLSTGEVMREEYVRPGGMEDRGESEYVVTL